MNGTSDHCGLDQPVTLAEGDRTLGHVPYMPKGGSDVFSIECWTDGCSERSISNTVEEPVEEALVEEAL